MWRNLLIVWGLTGLWHGAAWTFVLWGLYYGVLIGLERSVTARASTRLPRPVQHVYGVLVAVVGWVIFRSTSLHQVGEYYRAMVGAGPRGSGTRSDPRCSRPGSSWSSAVAGSRRRPAVDGPGRAGHGRALGGAERGRTALDAGPHRARRARRTPAVEAPTSRRTEPSRPAGRWRGDGGRGRGGAVADHRGGRLRADAGAQPGALEPERGAASAEPRAAVTLLVTAAGCLLLLVATAFVVATTYSPFIYFRF